MIAPPMHAMQNFVEGKHIAPLQRPKVEFRRLPLPRRRCSAAREGGSSHPRLSSTNLPPHPPSPLYVSHSLNQLSAPAPGTKALPLVRRPRAQFPSIPVLLQHPRSFASSSSRQSSTATSTQVPLRPCITRQFPTPCAVKRNSCRRRLRAAFHGAEAALHSSSGMQQLLSAAHSKSGLPLQRPM